MFLQFLDAAGYQTGVRREGFTEILAVLGSERFVGRGITDDEAEADLLRVMFPSTVARELLAARIATMAVPAPVTLAPTLDEPPDAPVAVEVAEPVASVTLPVDAPASPSTTVEVAPTVALALDAIAVESAPLSAPEPVEGPSSKLESVAAPLELPAALPAMATTSPVPSTPEPSRPKIDARAELATIEEILADIEDQLDDLGLLAPEGQRLLMLLFICRARACVERAPTSEVHAATARVAKRLSDLAKVFWPGSVRALQMHVMPADALPRRTRVQPTTWAEAANGVEMLIADRRYADNRAGRDEYGYADADSLSPRPPKEEALIVEVRSVLQSLEVSFDVSKAERAAAQLRWLRGRVPGREWGTLMGKLRQKLTLLGSEGTVLRDLLDANYAPATHWKELLGGKPAPAPTQAATPAPVVVDLAKLRAEVPATGCAEDVLISYLQRALVAFDTAGLVEVVRPLSTDLAKIAHVDVFADRRARRRWREVLSALSLVESDAPTSSQEGAAVEQPDDDESVDVGSEEFQALLASVVAETKGKRALFVSNREDPELEAKLSEMLGMTITWAEATPRRAQAACEKIARGSFDFVLSATGFQRHNVDEMLTNAARSGGIVRVRVNRGRPVTCVRAIARELGLDRRPRTLVHERALSDG